MDLHTLAGNAPLKRQLSAQARGRGLSHAYLISGPAGSGKKTLARLLAAAMVCTGAGERPCGACPACKKALAGIHPDIITLGADGKDLSVAQSRSVRSDAYIRPNEADRKVYLFENAGSMTPQAQNALLKLLEDGPSYAAFLLLTENPGALLTTIRSRCESIALSPVSLQEAQDYLSRRFPDRSPQELRQAAQSCGGLLGQAVAQLERAGEEDPVPQAAEHLLSLLAQGEELPLAAWCVSLERWDREELLRLLSQVQALLRDALALQAGLSLPYSPTPALLGTAKRPRKVLLGWVDLLERLRSHGVYHIGTGHLCGALAAGLASQTQS